MCGLRRGILLAIGLLFITNSPAQKTMPKEAKPTFEVATIKATPLEEQSQGFQIRGTHIKLVRETVLSMIMFAYGVHSKQVVDAPDWVNSEAFDVDGIPDVEGEPNTQQFQHLVRQLLSDRFNLRTHNARRELSYYALRVVPPGVKFVKSTRPDNEPSDQTGNGGPKGITMKYTNNTMDEFTLGMQYFTERPVVNETGLIGRYDFTLQWTPDSMKISENDAAPGLFTALREQLGLEFKPARGPVEVMVVDAVEKPSAN